MCDWTQCIQDNRSGRVIYLTHCLLNEHTRYLGGACRGGAIREIVQPCLEHDVGIIQLPCPEEHAWGGVLKHHLLRFLGSAGTVRYRLRGVLMPLILWYTRRTYRRLARQVAREIRDYRDAGVSVLGIVGVDGSPSCGVHQTLAMGKALEGLAQLKPETAMADDVNAIVRSSAISGTGIFTELLQEELDRRNVSTSFVAHDLLGELKGKPSAVRLEPLFETASPQR